MKISNELAFLTKNIALVKICIFINASTNLEKADGD